MCDMMCLSQRSREQLLMSKWLKITYFVGVQCLSAPLNLHVGSCNVMFWYFTEHFMPLFFLIVHSNRARFVRKNATERLLHFLIIINIRSSSSLSAAAATSIIIIIITIIHIITYL